MPALPSTRPREQPRGQPAPAYVVLPPPHSEEDALDAPPLLPQMFDLGERHEANVHAVLVPCKLNLAFCIVRMTELGEPLDARALDQVLDPPSE